MRLLFLFVLFSALLIKRGVDCVEVFAIKLFLSDSQGIGNTINIKYYNSSKTMLFFSDWVIKRFVPVVKLSIEKTHLSLYIL